MKEQELTEVSGSVVQSQDVYLRDYRGKRIRIGQKLLSGLTAWGSRALYQQGAWGYDLVSWLISLGCWRQWQRLALLEVRGDTVLEIGFGTGNLLATMGQSSRSTFGLEPSPTMHQITANRLQKINVEAPRVQAFSQAIPFATGSFDTVIAIFPAEYIVAPTTLQECARVLKEPSGRLVIIGLWVDVVGFWRHIALMFYGRPSTQIVEQVKTRMADAGFGTVRFCEIADGAARVGMIVAERSDNNVHTAVTLQKSLQD